MRELIPEKTIVDRDESPAIQKKFPQDLEVSTRNKHNPQLINNSSSPSLRLYR